MEPNSSRQVENTKRDAGLGVLLAAMGGDSSGAIEQEEARGQQSFVNSTQLPIKGTGRNEEMLRSWGIELGEPTDDLFREAILPDGWEKRATDHSMWSELVDDKGKVRAMIFYKAAFYDRSAFLRISDN